jgi:hypothetical protein
MRSTVLSLPLQLGFPALTLAAYLSDDVVADLDAVRVVKGPFTGVLDDHRCPVFDDRRLKSIFLLLKLHSRTISRA